MSSDLFGERPAGQPSIPGRGPNGGKRYTRPKGYAGQPGAGPDGMNCRHCAHYCLVVGGAKRYPKYALAQAKWTRGRGSDILARSPSCQFFADIKEVADGCG